MSGGRLPDEFTLIAEVFAPLAAGQPGAFDLTDDGAVLDVEAGEQLVVTVDAIVRDVHFLAADPPTDVGRKLLRVNLSDLAAMGARPVGYVLAVMLSSDVDRAWIEGFATGLAKDQALFGIGLYGGDTVSTRGPLSFSLTAFGAVPGNGALRRRGARPGDGVYVSGTLGDAAIGLKVLQGGITVRSADRDYLAGRYRLPTPRLALGQRLRGVASATVDVSDGLLSDLGHICAASEVSATVHWTDVPLSPAVRGVLADEPGLLAAVLSGGDDYELLFTAPAEAEDALATVSRALGLPIARIGRIETGSGVRVLDAGGQDITPESRGFRHF